MVKDNRLAENLTNARQNAGLLQRELAKLSQLAESSISNWERGIATPHPHNLRRIAQLLGVTVRELREGSNAHDNGSS